MPNDWPQVATLLSERRETLKVEAVRKGVEIYPARAAQITDLYFQERLANHPRLEAVFQVSSFCLVAVGGYGRNELCPGSDIDVLLLFEKKIPVCAEDLSSWLFHPLWDLGLDLGHGVRSFSDCISLAKNDYQVLASLLDLRFIAGDERVEASFRSLFTKKVATSKRNAFARWLKEQNEGREVKFGDSSGLLEPDLKNGLGSLRGVHQIGWCTAMLGKWTDPLTADERRSLDADYRFVLKARTALHLSAGRKTDTLHFDLQPRVAELLGYANKNADPLARGMAVEHFLSDLHKAMARIKMLRAVFWQECFPPRFWRTRKLSPAVEDTAVGLGFILSGPVRPAEMLELFAQAAATGRPLSLAANRAIREAISTGIDTFEGSAETLAALLDVFRAPFGLHAALTMVDTGLMAALLPRFSEVEHLVQFDDYHVHPVGRHTVETVGRVADLLSGRDERFRDLAANVVHPDRLLLAALFHDLGKGGPNHSAIGAELVRETLAGFGLDKATVRDAAFLVEHHLLIPKTATRGDLSDERVVAGVAEIAETLERLDMLYLLSVADSMATGPRAWSAWTGSLFQELYRKARNLLTSGPLSEPEVAQAARATRERARVEACGSLDEAYVNDCLAKMPPRAFQALGPLDLVRHMTLVRQLQVALDEDAVRMPGKNKGVGISAIEARKTGVGNTFEVSIATQDRPGLFATLAGVLALHQLDILAADLFTWKDGTVVDVFIVEGPGDNLFPEEVFERVRRAIRYAFLGKLSLGYRLDEMRKSPLYRSGSGPKLPPVVRVNNQASDFHTLIEVAASDCLGLLYDIALTLANMYVSIHLAKITTDAGRIADVFYVLASDGRKLDDPGLVRQVEAELLKVVKHS